MTPSTKVFATLALSSAVGKKIQESEESETIKALGSSLYESGFEATDRYPYSKLTLNKIEQVLNAVESMLENPLEPPEILSMLIAGLTDIRAKVKPERKELIDPVIWCAQACLDAYAYDPDHEAAWERYLDWLTS